MKYLIFSDVHSDQVGFQALLSNLAFVADRKICLGDVINAHDEGSSDFFNQVVASVDEVILGNHEAVLVSRCDVGVFNPKVQDAIRANTARLALAEPEFLEKLRTLPMQIRIGESAVATHGSFNPASAWQHIRYTEDVQKEEIYLPARVNFNGHGHIPFIAWKENGFWYYDRQIYGKTYHLDSDKQYLINCGSILGSREMRQYEKTFLNYDDERQQVEFINIGAV